MAPLEKAALAIEDRRRELAEDAVRREFERRPEFWGRFGRAGQERCLEDAHFHLRFLATALALDEPVIFTDYVRWLAELLEGYGMGPEDVLEHLSALRDTLKAQLEPDDALHAIRMLEEGLGHLGRAA